MSEIRISSVREPLTNPYLARAAVETLGRAAAMGLLPEDQVIETLDLASLRDLARHVGAVGVAPAAVAQLAGWKRGDARRLGSLLEAVSQALAESPVPEREWGELLRVLGEPLLARLTGVSSSSLRRYVAGSRRTPDEVALRLHHVALIVGHLAGSYNEYGIRRWFERRRSTLKGQAPADLLAGEWSPEARGPAEVLVLAAQLVGAGAT
jgi:hypothetical protein